MTEPTEKLSIVKKAKTDWRRLVAYVLLVVATAGAVYLAGTTVRDTRTLKRQARDPNVVCVELKNREYPNGIPSPGCEKQLRLFLEVCVGEPELCLRAAKRVVVNSDSRESRLLLRSIGDFAESGDGNGGPGGVDGGGGGGGTSPTNPSQPGGPQGTVQPPGNNGGGNITPPPGGGGGGGNGGGGNSPDNPPGNTVPETFNNVADTVNDITEDLGIGRPLPSLPRPALPMQQQNPMFAPIGSLLTTR